MLIFSIFDQSIELEQALAELEANLVPRENILIVFMDDHSTKNEFKEQSPTGFEIGISVATGAAVIGASSGFILTWGPILWGLIGAVVGFILGFISFILYKRVKIQTILKKENYEVSVVIQCKENQVNSIGNILWKYQARSVGYHNSSNKKTPQPN